MAVRRARLGAATVGLLLATGLAIPQAARAVETPDQSQPSDAGFETSLGSFTDFDSGLARHTVAAQTFTAGLSGGLTRVEVEAVRDASTDPLIVEVRSVDGSGTPTATVLASTEIQPADIPADWASRGHVSAVFNVPAEVVAGTSYALVLRPASPTDLFGLMGTTTPGAYPGGRYFISLDDTDPFSETVGLDMLFTTYVDPEVTYDPACSGTGHRAGYHTIVGTTGADTIVGTAGRDLIYGLGGNDVIKGLGGDDRICSGDGNDTVFAGTGDDRVFGGAGDDRIVGNKGRDRLHGGDGNDSLAGRAGRDHLYGERGDDVLRGGSGRDVLRGGPGADDVDGGRGRDDVTA